MIKARQQKGAPDAPQQTAQELREAQAADAAAEREAAAQELAFTDADHAGLEQDLAAAEAERAALAAAPRADVHEEEEGREAVLARLEGAIEQGLFEALQKGAPDPTLFLARVRSPWSPPPPPRPPIARP